MARRRNAAVRAKRWLFGDPKPKANGGKPPGVATAAARTSVQLPALNFDAHVWVHKLARTNPEATIVVRSRSGNGVVGEVSAVEIVASGISIYDMLRTTFGDGHYWLQARTGLNPETASLSVAEPITVGTPPALGIALAANKMQTSRDGTDYLEGLSRDVAQLEPLVRLFGGGGGQSNALQDRMMEAMIDQMMAPAPDPIDEMIRMKRAMAEAFPVVPVAATATAPAGGWAAAVGAISDGLSILRKVAETPQPTPARAVANADAKRTGDPAETAVADVTATATDDVVGAFVMNLITAATNAAHPSPPNIAQACVDGYYHAAGQSPDHWMVRLFETDPGQVFDLFYAHAGNQITASPDLMAAARGILVEHVEAHNAAENAPVEVDGDGDAAVDDDAPVDVQGVEIDADGDEGSPDVRASPEPVDVIQADQIAERETTAA